VLLLLFIGLWALLFVIGYPMPAAFLGLLAVEAAFLGLMRLSVKGVRSTASFQRLHWQLLAVEVICHTGIFYVLGGLSWLGVIAYVYAILYASVFLTPRQAAAFTMVLIAAFLVVVSVDATGTVPHQWYLPQGPDRYQNVEFLLTTSIAFAGVLGTITFWMVFIGTELRRERDTAVKANTELVATQNELRKLNEELEMKVAQRTQALVWRAEHDTLTGLLNRGAVNRRLRELVALARRGGRPLTVVIADADRFKVCNDTAGHAYGDEVIRAIAGCLETTGRETDLSGRLGGDEFLVILPDTAARGAARYCRRLLRCVAEARRNWEPAGPPIPTLSLGIAVFPEHGSGVDELVRAADRAMYQAKADGGNRASVATPDTASSPAERISA
jgi:diguanylate cyclase (GGDEF)-like protein